MDDDDVGLRDAAAWNGAVSHIFVLFLREGEGGYGIYSDDDKRAVSE